MNTIYHIGLDVRGALTNMTKTQMKRMAPSVTVDGKRLKTADEVRDMLLDQLAKGHEMLPMAECDNWDWRKGCGGHEEEDHESGAV